jgi:hypothetical protein
VSEAARKISRTPANPVKNVSHMKAAIVGAERLKENTPVKE